MQNEFYRIVKVTNSREAFPEKDFFIRNDLKKLDEIDSKERKVDKMELKFTCIHLIHI